MIILLGVDILLFLICLYLAFLLRRARAELAKTAKPIVAVKDEILEKAKAILSQDTAAKIARANAIAKPRIMPKKVATKKESKIVDMNDKLFPPW